EGLFTIITRDLNGHPVSAEVALGLVDESVFYIQKDLAGDPRQFYYGTKRAQYVQTVSTFQQKAYAKLVVGANQQLVTIRDTSGREEDERRKDDSPFQRSQLTVNGMLMDRVAAVSESVTVTANDEVAKKAEASGEF